MIPYYGTPITPLPAAVAILSGRHALVSFAHPEQMVIVAEVCESFALDNGAFSHWKAGSMPDWDRFYVWVEEWARHPAFDFALIPDVIDGDEDANDALLCDCPISEGMVPVWHLHESLNRLERLAVSYSRVALGSSGEFAAVKTDRWWMRMAEAMEVVCDEAGRPRVKLHGLRMLDPEIFGVIPLASADSTNVAKNISLDQRWRGPYAPPSEAVRGLVMVDRIKTAKAATAWDPASAKRTLPLFR